jgi:hypothetical protein
MHRHVYKDSFNNFHLYISHANDYLNTLHTQVLTLSWWWQEAGFRVPEPIDQNRHCVVMSLVDAYPLTQVRELRNPGRPQPSPCLVMPSATLFSVRLLVDFHQEVNVNLHHVYIAHARSSTKREDLNIIKKTIAFLVP